MVTLIASVVMVTGAATCYLFALSWETHSCKQSLFVQGAGSQAASANQSL